MSKLIDRMSSYVAMCRAASLVQPISFSIGPSEVQRAGDGCVVMQDCGERFTAYKYAIVKSRPGDTDIEFTPFASDAIGIHFRRRRECVSLCKNTSSIRKLMYVLVSLNVVVARPIMAIGCYIWDKAKELVYRK